MRRIAAVSPTQWAKQVVDFLFGYDFFISYAWDDGTGYPRALKDRLTRNGYTVFLDSEEYVPGTDLRASTGRRVRMSRYVVLILRPHAAASLWVERELKAFLTTGRDAIAIDVNETWAALAPEEFCSKTFAERLRISETVAKGGEAPSDFVVAELGRAFKSTRREVVRGRFVTAAAATLFVILIVALWQWYDAELQRRISDALALDARAGQHFSQAAQAATRWDREWARQIELETELASVPADKLLRIQNLEDEILEVEALRRSFTIKAREERSQGKRLLEQARAAWEKADFLHSRASADHRNEPPLPRLFSVEVLSVGFGESMVLHYGDVDAPKFIVIDGGQPRTYQQSLAPRLAELRRAWSNGGPLTLENVIVSNQDDDRVGGILKLLDEIWATKKVGAHPPVSIRNVWYESFGPGYERNQKARVRLRIEQIGLPLNKPFPTNVMRPVNGSVVIDMGDGLQATVLGPAYPEVDELYAFWRKRAERDGMGAPEPPVEDYKDVPGVMLDPALKPPAPEDGCKDQSDANRASHIVLFRFAGKTFLHPGDACATQIEVGLAAAGLVAEDGSAKVDLLLVPHQGSRNSNTPGFFRRIKADHYLFTGNGKFDGDKLREQETLVMLLEARKGESYTLQFINRDGEKEHGDKLDAFLAAYPPAIYGYHRVFRSSTRGAMSIDLLDDRVRY